MEKHKKEMWRNYDLPIIKHIIIPMVLGGVIGLALIVIIGLSL